MMLSLNRRSGQMETNQPSAFYERRFPGVNQQGLGVLGQNAVKSSHY
jgi:hypothetical protein